MTDLDAISRALAAQGERKRRLDAARTARDALTLDELEQFVAETVGVYQAKAEGAAAAASGQRPPMLKIDTAPPLKVSMPVGKVTLRQAVMSVLAGGAVLGTGDIYAHVVELVPGAKYVSVASEIKKMKLTDPPMLVQRGSNAKGHGVYALAAGLRTNVAR